ncbi:kinase-like domain-containing protein [Coniochaeta sp. 2T2.1]|nr:kinase-like domain-containing protein [Coniochaeta sp. 2T2.1]
MPYDRDPDSVPATPDEFLDDSNPASPGSVDDSSEASTPYDAISSGSDAVPSPLGSGLSAPALEQPRRVPSLRTVSDPQNSTLLMSSSSVTGALNNARRPTPSANALPLDIMARARAIQQQRMGVPTRPPMTSQPGGSARNPSTGGMSSPFQGSMNLNLSQGLPGGVPANLKLPGGLAGSRPLAQGFPRSAPAVPSVNQRQSLSERRAAMKLGGLPGGSPATTTPKLSVSDIQGSGDSSINGEGRGSKLSDFNKYIDSEKGWVTFEGAATITRDGVQFTNGATFSISLDQVTVLAELGKGNYGTVYKVRHAKPQKPRFGQGLSGYRTDSMSDNEASDDSPVTPQSGGGGPETSGAIMAMKEIRLELDESKFATILKELVILHECVSPYIIDFYGAFFQESAVYMCIEYMDGGSIDKLYVGGIPEPVLRKITYATIMGLKTLKDDHKIIHRDVKPTNILVNTRGQVKICDFGVSGNLVASIAKTNIGCQSYMAPERISGGGMSASGAAGGTYSVQSDIWSLGLTIIECAMGRYPYPPEISSTIFSQLSAIVNGDPPDLPAEGYSDVARDFVKCCLNKEPRKRHTYPQLLSHPWLKPLTKPSVIAEDIEAEEAADALSDATGRLELDSTGISAGGDGSGDREVAAWVQGVLEKKRRGLLKDGVPQPALHAAPLDSVSPAGSPAIQA